MNLPNKTRTPVAEADVKDLTYWGKRIDDDLKSGKTPAQFVAKNKQLLAAIQAELKQRRGQAVEQQAQQATAIEKAATMALGENNGDPKAVTEFLIAHAAVYHLVSPTTRVDAIPEGCGVAVTYVTVNPSTEKDGPKEVYQVGDRLGLSMDTLKRIAAAAGLDWDTQLCGRLDDGSDPHYCHYRAVGHVRNLDGSVRTVSGEVEMDAREGSPQIEEIRTKAANSKDRNGNPAPRDPSAQVLELRKFLLRHAESKAKNRAIADMGVKRSYAPQELMKPFAVTRLMWTGQTRDPELRRIFAEKTADAMIGGMSSLYGAKPLPERAPAAPSFSGHSPPPVGQLVSAPSFDESFVWDEETPVPATSKKSTNTETTAQPAAGEPVGDGYDDRGNDPDKY